MALTRLLSPMEGNITRLRRTLIAILVVVVLPSAAHSQAPQNPNIPVFKVEVWGSTVADFNTRVGAYVEIRTELEKGLPPRRVTDDVAEIKTAERALADKI